MGKENKSWEMPAMQITTCMMTSTMYGTGRKDQKVYACLQNRPDVVCPALTHTCPLSHTAFPNSYNTFIFFPEVGTCSFTCPLPCLGPSDTFLGVSSRCQVPALHPQSFAKDSSRQVAPANPLGSCQQVV